MADGFLNRWSKRKAGKQDDLVEQPKEAVQTPAPISTAEEAKPPASLEDVEIVAICDIKKECLNETADKYNVSKRYGDNIFSYSEGLRTLVIS